MEKVTSSKNAYKSAVEAVVKAKKERGSSSKSTSLVLPHTPSVEDLKTIEDYLKLHKKTSKQKEDTYLSLIHI